MSRSKHEALRHDIEDYKLLLVKYQSLRIEQETLTADLERQSKLLNNNNDKYRNALKRIDVLEQDIAYVRKMIEDCNLSKTDKDKSYNALKKMYYNEKGKRVSMQKQQANVYVWKVTTVFFFLAMLLIGSQN